jgi:hypothetical protein
MVRAITATSLCPRGPARAGLASRWVRAPLAAASGVCAALGLAAGVGAVILLAATRAHAQRVENAVAVFAALDKVTAKISRLEVPLNQTATFGSLKVTPRICYTRGPLEPPKTTTFVEVEEVQLDGKEKRIFSGWMFADSPGLNAVEHPVFDLWLTDCSHPRASQHASPAPGARPAPLSEPEPETDPDQPRRRRVPR